MMKLNTTLLMIFLLLIQISNMAVASELVDQEQIKTRFNALYHLFTSDEKEDKKVVVILEKWEAHVAAKKKYSHQAFINAIMKYQTEYWNSLTALSGCIEKLTEQERRNSSTDWIAAFEKKYGNAYIKKNQKAIVAALSATHSMNSEEYCGPNWKDALAKEAFLFHACKMYLSEFLIFYESLNDKEKLKIASRKDFVTTLLNDMAHGYVGVMYDAVSMLRPDLDVYRAVTENKEIFQLIKSQPELQGPFDIDKVFQHLIAITTN